MYFSLLLSPLLSVLLLLFNFNFFGNRSIIIITTIFIGFSWLLSHVILYDIFCLSITVSFDLGDWIIFNEIGSSFAFYFDFTSAIFLYIVTFISFLVHVYSLFYINQDPFCVRFFLYLNLFTWFIIVLVTAENLVLIFLGWEGIGITSFLLINFWFLKLQSGKSAMKAVIFNRIGDSFFLMGLGLIYLIVGSDNLVLLSVSSLFIDKILVKSIIMCFILAAIAKSAQILLHAWLPDAIEAPTPVSSLLHAATLVGAGVYLIIKLSLLGIIDSDSSLFLIMIGLLTSFFAGLVGFSQYDIKRVIAYSTCSQIGLIFYAIGLLSIDYSCLHFVIHGNFKCLMFLLAGSFLHIMLNEQDIRKYAGLSFIQNFLSCAFVLSSFSLLGLIFTAGFYSKELILISSGFYTNIWSVLSIFSIITTCLYGLKSIFLVTAGSPNWNSMVSLSVYDVNFVVVSLLTVLLILNTFSGPFVIEIIKLFDIVSNKNSFFSSENTLFIVEHINVNWVLLLVLIVFLIFYWNYVFNFFGDKDYSFTLKFRSLFLFFYQRFGFDGLYGKFGFGLVNFSYNVCWISNDRGWLISIIYYFFKNIYEVITKYNLSIQNGSISLYYLSLVLGSLFLFILV